MPYYNWKKTIILVIIGVIIGFVGRGFVGGSFDDGWQAVRDQIQGNNYRKIVIDKNDSTKDIYFVEGVVTEIDGKKLVLRDNANFLQEAELRERVININNETAVNLKQQRSQDDRFMQLDKEKYLEIKSLEDKLSQGGLDRNERADIKTEITELNNFLNDIYYSKIEDLKTGMREFDRGSVEAESLRSELNGLTSSELIMTISYRDIQVGDHIIVKSTEDIRYEEKITAQEIEIER